MSHRWPPLLLAVSVMLLLLCPMLHAAPLLTFHPARLTFPPEGGTRTVELRNRSDEPLQLQGLAFTADSGGFATEPLPLQVLSPGQALQVAVTYTAQGRRTQALGALLVYCNDPRGTDDPRSEQVDLARGLPLSAGESPLLLLLVLPTLLLGGVLSLFRWRLLALWTARLASLGGLLLAVYSAQQWVPGLAVQEGNYGMQFIWHRTLWPAQHLELFWALDGLSQSLVLLTLLWSALVLCCPRRLLGALGVFSPGAVLLLVGCSLLVLCALDVGSLLLGWSLLLAVLFGLTKTPATVSARRGLGVGALLLMSALGLCCAVGLLCQHSLPTALPDGTAARHTTDLVKLAYYNYFGLARVAGLPLMQLLWPGLLLCAWLPLGFLVLRRGPLPIRLLLSVPLVILAVYLSLRTACAFFPEPTVQHAPWLAAAAVVWVLVGALLLLRQRTWQAALPTLLVSRVGLLLLGLAGGTQLALQGLLLGLWSYALLALLTVWVLAAPQWLVRPGRWWLLLTLDLPGTGGALSSLLLLLGAFPLHRLAVGGLGLLVYLLPWLWLWRSGLPASTRAHLPATAAEARPARVTVYVGAVAAGQMLLGLHPQPLLTAQATWVNDFLSHTFGHLGAGSLALLW